MENRCNYCSENVPHEGSGLCPDCQQRQDAATKPLHVRIETLERENAALRDQVSRGQDAVNTLNDRLATLRQCHAKEMEATWKAGFIARDWHVVSAHIDAAWLASEPKARLT